MAKVENLTENGFRVTFMKPGKGAGVFYPGKETGSQVGAERRSGSDPASSPACWWDGTGQAFMNVPFLPAVRSELVMRK